MKDWEELAILQEFRAEQRQREMRQRYTSQAAGHHAAGTVDRKANYHHARHKEKRILAKIKYRGFPVLPTGHNDRFDAWIGGARVEVKYSHWKKKSRGSGCYQAQIRNYRADVLVFDAINGSDHYFIIPMSEVIGRRTVEICSYDVNLYAGQWSIYLERWDLLARAVATSPPMASQLEMFE